MLIQEFWLFRIGWSPQIFDQRRGMWLHVNSLQDLQRTSYRYNPENYMTMETIIRLELYILWKKWWFSSQTYEFLGVNFQVTGPDESQERTLQMIHSLKLTSSLPLKLGMVGRWHFFLECRPIFRYEVLVSGRVSVFQKICCTKLHGVRSLDQNTSRCDSANVKPRRVICASCWSTKVFSRLIVGEVSRWEVQDPTYLGIACWSPKKLGFKGWTQPLFWGDLLVTGINIYYIYR